jgi:thiamine-monophosphate kinase
MSGELAAIERIRALLPAATGDETWIGDDAAVVAAPEGRLLLTTDAVVAGVHVDLSLAGVEDLGWKAMSSAVSDIAAVGGRPRHALVTVCVPAATDLDLLYAGIAGAAAAYACPVVGGDLCGGSQLVVSVAVTGDSGDSPPVLRSGAQPGDAIFVTGPLGSSSAGLRALRAGAGQHDPRVGAHLRPRARVDEGRAARAAGATAMIDVSDGLAADLYHVAEASGVGMVVDDVPVAQGASLDDALGGGEDYELVFTTARASAATGPFVEAGLGPPVLIGRCTPDGGRVLLGDEPMPRVGWEHRWSG